MNSYNELPKVYSPSEFEDRIYQNWCDKGYFTPDVNDPAPSFSVVIPPPNVTGQLHMGHALDETLQDILTAAVNEAIRTVQDTNEKEMSKVTGSLNMGGLGMPGMF